MANTSYAKKRKWNDFTRRCLQNHTICIAVIFHGRKNQCWLSDNSIICCRKQNAGVNQWSFGSDKIMEPTIFTKMWNDGLLQWRYKIPWKYFPRYYIFLHILWYCFLHYCGTTFIILYWLIETLIFQEIFNVLWKSCDFYLHIW